MYLLSIDSETGGLDYAKFSLLTFTMSVVDENSKIIDTLNLKLKPDDGVYHLSAESMKVNRINIVEHDLNARKYSEMKNNVASFIYKNYSMYGKLTVLGQNCGFDLDNLFYYLIDKNTWYQYVDRRVIDLISISKLLQFKGLIPEDQELNLQKLCGFWGIEVDESITHTSDFDSQLNVELWKKYKSLDIKIA